MDLCLQKLMEAVGMGEFSMQDVGHAIAGPQSELAGPSDGDRLQKRRSASRQDLGQRF